MVTFELRSELIEKEDLEEIWEKSSPEWGEVSMWGKGSGMNET